MQTAKNYNVLRVSQNLKALGALKSKQPEADILKNYTGWGGLREAIYTPEVYRELKKLLTANEIASLKQTLSSAYYTPVKVVQFIYQAIAKLNKPLKRILEPSIGHGVFIEQMPQTLRAQAKIIGVEIDEASCKLVSQLYPELTIKHTGFQAFDTDVRFDLIIGNPPYGRDALTDRNHPDLSELKIHHYFVAKCMRLLADDGVLVMVLPKYFLDNRRDHARHIIHKEGGRLLAAYRLPDDLFCDAKVTVDIVFLTKQSGVTDWLHAEKQFVDGKPLFINRYFIQNPSHIIGKLSAIEAFGRAELTCKHSSQIDTFEALNTQLQAFPPAQLRSLPEYKAMLKQKLDVINAKITQLNKEREELLQVEREIAKQEAVFLRHCHASLSKFE